MAMLTLRSEKGTPLTTEEVDGNFTSLNNALTTVEDIAGSLGAVGNFTTRNTYAIADWNDPVYSDASFLSSEAGTPNAPTAGHTYGVQTSYHQYGPQYRTQIVTSLYSDSELWVRNATDGDVWNAWKKLLHSGNFDDHALSLAGGTVSGAVTFTHPSFTVGGSTGSAAYALGSGATAAGAFKDVLIGQGGTAGSNTTVALGSATAGANSFINVHGVLSILNPGSAHYGTLSAGALTAPRTFQLPDAGGTLALGDGTGAAGTWNIDIWGRAQGLRSADTRSTNPAPGAAGIGATFDFKENSADGLADGGTFHTVLTVQQWTDASGGGARQLAFTDGDNLWLRGSGAGLSGWGAWRRLAFASETGVAVRSNGTPVGTRRALNLIPGTNVTIAAADDSAGEAVNVTIHASGASASGTYWHFYEIDGDVHYALNATWDGTHWNRVDITRPAWLRHVNLASTMLFENYKADTLWIAQPHSSAQISGFTTPNGWFMASSMSQWKDFTIGGNGIEVDGNLSWPFGRLAHASVSYDAGATTAVRTGMLRNAFLDEQGRDDATRSSWWAGFHTNAATGVDAFKVQYAPAGGTNTDPVTNWQDLLSLDIYGLVVPVSAYFGNGAAFARADAPPIAAADTVRLHGKRAAHRMHPAVIDEWNAVYPLQPSLWRQRVGLWSPGGNATAVPGVSGFAAPTALGTATARTVATTNAMTRARRLGYVSAAAAASFAGHYQALAQYTVGDGAGTGGFFYAARFAFTDAAAVSGVRGFVGLCASTAAPTNTAEPTALVNAIGLAQISSDTTQLYLAYGGSAAQTAIALGTNFPPFNGTVSATSGPLYELVLFANAAQNGVIHYRVERVGTGFVVEGTLAPATPGTQTPASTTLLGHRAWRCTNAATQACAIDIAHVYLESDY